MLLNEINLNYKNSGSTTSKKDDNIASKIKLPWK